MKYVRDWDKWLQGKSNKQILKKLSELHDLVEVDELTRLANFRAFRRELKFAMANFKRFETKFCVVNIDLAGFKKINDTFGHTEGDKVLIFFANKLKESTRETDIAFRVGGDEFATILTHTDIKSAKQFMDRFLQNLAKEKESLDAGSVYRLARPSYAISEWKEKDVLDTYLKKLDAKMYEKKRS